MNKHAPAPWHTELRDGCRAIVDGNGKDITYLDIAPRFFNGEPCGSVTSRGRTVEELAATAELLAAAPALLTALKDAADMLRLMGVDMQAHEMTRQMLAAIAKAEGRAS